MDRPARHDRESGQSVVLELPDAPDEQERAAYQREGAQIVLGGPTATGTADRGQAAGRLVIDAGAVNPPGELEARVVAARRDGGGSGIETVIAGVDSAGGRSEADQLRLAALVRRTRRAVDLAGWLDPLAGAVGESWDSA